MNVRPLIICLVSLVLVFGAAGCSATGSSSSSTTTGVSSPGPDDTTSTTTTRPRLTLPDRPTTPSSPTTVAPPDTVPADAGDWDGTTYDFGNVMQASAKGSTVTINFDRYQVYAENGLIEGEEIADEPLIYANTDVAYENESTKQREYALAPDADIEVLSNVDAICGSFFNEQSGEVGPVYERVTSRDLVSWSVTGADLAPPGFDRPGQDAVTFDGQGQVIRLVFLSSC